MEKIETKQLSIGKRLRFSENGTNYDIIATYLPKGIVCGYMCLSNPSVLIISGYDKSAYAFALEGYLSPDYVWEKLCPKCNLTDAKSLLKLIEEARKQILEELKSPNQKL